MGNQVSDAVNNFVWNYEWTEKNRTGKLNNKHIRVFPGYGQDLATALWEGNTMAGLIAEGLVVGGEVIGEVITEAEALGEALAGASEYGTATEAGDSVAAVELDTANPLDTVAQSEGVSTRASTQKRANAISNAAGAGAAAQGAIDWAAKASINKARKRKAAGPPPPAEAKGVTRGSSSVTGGIQPIVMQPNFQQAVIPIELKRFVKLRVVPSNFAFSQTAYGYDAEQEFIDSTLEQNTLFNTGYSIIPNSALGYYVNVADMQIIAAHPTLKGFTIDKVSINCYLTQFIHTLPQTGDGRDTHITDQFYTVLEDKHGFYSNEGVSAGEKSIKYTPNTFNTQMWIPRGFPNTYDSIVDCKVLTEWIPDYSYNDVEFSVTNIIDPRTRCPHALQSPPQGFQWSYTPRNYGYCNAVDKLTDRETSIKLGDLSGMECVNRQGQYIYEYDKTASALQDGAVYDTHKKQSKLPVLAIRANNVVVESLDIQPVIILHCQYTINMTLYNGFDTTTRFESHPKTIRNQAEKAQMRQILHGNRDLYGKPPLENIIN